MISLFQIHQSDGANKSRLLALLNQVLLTKLNTRQKPQAAESAVVKRNLRITKKRVKTTFPSFMRRKSCTLHI